jgi:hypothetical protein
MTREHEPVEKGFTTKMPVRPEMHGTDRLYKTIA